MPSSTVTIGHVRDMLNACRESDEPDAVLAVFRAEAGKPFTKRILAKLPGGEARWGIRQIAGMTHIEDRDYRGSTGNRGISLLVAHKLTGITIDPDALVKLNTAYFEARVRRNEEREAALADDAKLASMATALTRVLAARAALAAAEAGLNALVDWGEPFAADSTTWHKMGGEPSRH